MDYALHWITVGPLSFKANEATHPKVLYQVPQGQDKHHGGIWKSPGVPGTWQHHNAYPSLLRPACNPLSFLATMQNARFL